jgi:hypothetical protein
MSYSLRAADRQTHVKIVAVSLIAGLVVGLGVLHARWNGRGNSDELSSDRVVIAPPRAAVHALADQAVVR